MSDSTAQDMDRMIAPAVSVILACRNEADQIESCLESLLRQEQPKGGIEFLIADGMSTDGTRVILDQLAARQPRLRIIDNPGKIVSTGLNECIRQARGAVIIRMDAHTEYASDYVSMSLEVLEQTGADNVGGAARTRGNSLMQQAICAAYHSPFSVGGARFHDVEFEGYVDTVPYGCWHATAFDRFGLFDPELVRNQDDEFNFRIMRGGGKIWQSRRIRSWYWPRSSLAALFRQYMQYGYWKVRVIQKHGSPASLRHLVPGLFVGSLLGLVILMPFAAWARWAAAFLLFLYLSLLVVACWSAAGKSDWKLLPYLPLVFPCYHFGYGYGFLRGVVDFLLLRRGGRGQFSDLTRAAPSPSLPSAEPKS